MIADVDRDCRDRAEGRPREDGRQVGRLTSVEGGPWALRAQGPASPPRPSEEQFARLEAELANGTVAHGREGQQSPSAALLVAYLNDVALVDAGAADIDAALAALDSACRERT